MWKFTLTATRTSIWENSIWKNLIKEELFMLYSMMFRTMQEIVNKTLCTVMATNSCRIQHIFFYRMMYWDYACGSSNKTKEVYNFKKGWILLGEGWWTSLKRKILNSEWLGFFFCEYMYVFKFIYWRTVLSCVIYLGIHLCAWVTFLIYYKSFSGHNLNNACCCAVYNATTY